MSDYHSRKIALISSQTQHGEHIAQLQFTPFWLSMGLKDVCANCPVFCICPCHLFSFDWVHTVSSGDRLCCPDCAVGAFCWVIPTDCTSERSVCHKQGWNRPVDPVTRASLREPQQEADGTCLLCGLIVFDEDFRQPTKIQTNKKTNKINKPYSNTQI